MKKSGHSEARSQESVVSRGQEKQGHNQVKSAAEAFEDGFNHHGYNHTLKIGVKAATLLIALRTKRKAVAACVAEGIFVARRTVISGEKAAISNW